MIPARAVSAPRVALSFACAAALFASACGARVTVGELTPEPAGGGGGGDDGGVIAPGPIDAGGADSAPLDGGGSDAGGYQPCAGRTCGSACTICAPGDATCAETAVLKYCDDKGTCAPTVPTCGALDGGGAYVPCAGKVCGASCTICQPGVPGCFETAVLKYCNSAGTCSPSPPGC